MTTQFRERQKKAQFSADSSGTSETFKLIAVRSTRSGRATEGTRVIANSLRRTNGTLRNLCSGASAKNDELCEARRKENGIARSEQRQRRGKERLDVNI